MRATSDHREVLWVGHVQRYNGSTAVIVPAPKPGSGEPPEGAVGFNDRFLRRDTALSEPTFEVVEGWATRTGPRENLANGASDGGSGPEMM